MEDDLEPWEHVTCDGSYTFVERSETDRFPLAARDSVLHEAAYNGDVTQLALALAELDDINLPNSFNFTPLALAVHGNQPETIRLLLSAGANHQLQSCNIGFDTAVELAAHSGSNDALIALADAGVEIPAMALHSAAYSRSIDCIRTILHRLSSIGIDSQQFREAVERSLQIAAEFHYKDVLEILLSSIHGFPDRGKEIDREALTAAMRSLLFQSECDDRKVYPGEDLHMFPILQLLIAAGAQVDSRAFFASVYNGSVSGDVVGYLFDHGLQVNDTRHWDECDRFQSMIFSVVIDDNDNAPTLELFLAAGADLTVRDKHLNTPLHLAAHASYTAMLLDCGADVDAANIEGLTPLYTACLHNRLDVARLLISRGADVSTIAQDKHWLSLVSAMTGATAWTSSPFRSWTLPYDDAAVERIQLCELLLSHGANIRASTDDGSTALHITARRGDSTLVSYLIAHGAQVSASNTAGQTALHNACGWPANVLHWSDSNGHDLFWPRASLDQTVVRVLLDKGADANVMDSGGITPLHAVMRDQIVNADSWRPDIFNLLLERGANLDATAHGDDRTIRSHVDHSKWRLNEIGLLEQTPAKPAHARADPSMRGRGSARDRGRGCCARGRGRGCYLSTWT